MRHVQLTVALLLIITIKKQIFKGASLAIKDALQSKQEADKLYLPVVCLCMFEYLVVCI